MSRLKRLKKLVNGLQNTLIFNEWHLIWHLVKQQATKKEPQTLYYQCLGTL